MPTFRDDFNATAGTVTGYIYRQLDINGVDFNYDGNGYVVAHGRASFTTHGGLVKSDLTFDTAKLRMRFNLGTLPPNGNTQAGIYALRATDYSVVAYMQWVNYNGNYVRLVAGSNSINFSSNLNRSQWYRWELEINSGYAVGRIFNDSNQLLASEQIPITNYPAVLQFSSGSDGQGVVFDYIEIDSFSIGDTAVGPQGFSQFYLVDGAGNDSPLWGLRVAEPPPSLDITPLRTAGSSRQWHVGDGQMGAHQLRLVGPLGDEVATATLHLDQLVELQTIIDSAVQVEYDLEGTRYYIPLETSAPLRGEYRRLNALKFSRYSTLEVLLNIQHRNWKRKSDGLEFGPIV